MSSLRARPAAVLVVLAAAVAPAIGQESDPADAAARLALVHSLKCTFPEGTLGSYEGNTFKIETAKEGMGGPMHFDGIDRQARRARLIGNASATDVGVIHSVGSLSFVEVTDVGSINLTTVFAYPAPGKPKAFAAVHSRHITGIPGVIAPIPSQYHGYCEVWE